jgi:hypothetical protein
MIPQRRLLLLAVLFLALSALLLTCAVAGAQTVTVAGGIGTSVNLGEQNPGYQAQVLVAHRTGPFAWEASGLVDSANKYTGAGYSVNGVFDAAMLGSHDIGVLAGVEYSYRNGGDWSKQTVWLRGGVEGRRSHEVFRIIARATFEATDDTRTRMVQLEYRKGWGRWWMLVDSGFVWYTQPDRSTGFYSGIRVGYCLHKETR